MGVFDSPDLIEPITVTIESIDKSATPVSTGIAGRREIVNNVVRTSFDLQAQVVFGNVDQDQKSSQLGTDEESSGYLIIRPKDLLDQAVTIKRGDRITKFTAANGTVTALPNPLYFQHSVNDLGAHFANSGFSFTRCLFTDRNPLG